MSGTSTSAPETFRAKAAMRKRLSEWRREHPGQRVAIVPTMGSFHEGHLSLMRAARQEGSIVIVSIFVNPIQFAAGEDLNNYQRDISRDSELAAGAGVDMIFAPGDAEMYPPGFDTHIEVGEVATGLCADSRPGHFQGVATVVAKLFNVVRPDVAVFGQKDAQQVAVLRRMVTDLDFDVKIRVEPTVRESDGLAMSSRNTYLSPEERAQAPTLYQALSEAREAVAAGETSVARLRRAMKKKIAAQYLVELDYARIVDPETMQPVTEVQRPALAAVAAQVGRARLIDNEMLYPPGGKDAKTGS